jgi:integrase
MTEHYRRGIAKLPGGRYRVRVVVRGRVIKRTLPSRRTAELFRDQVLASRAGLRWTDVPTLAEALEAYRQRCIGAGLSSYTVEQYEWLTVAILRHLGAETRGDLIQADADAYVTARLAEGGKPNTIKLELAHLRRCLLAASVPVEWTAPKLKTVSNPRHVYRDLEVARVYLTLGDARVRRGLLLGLLAGMRPTEILRAQSSWVHLESGEIQIPPQRQKTSVTNRLPLVATLARELEGVEGALVPMAEAAVRAALRRVSARLSLEPELGGYETFRHTAATWALEATGDRGVVDLILSHSIQGASRYYTQLAQVVAPKRKALEAVESRFLAAVATVRAVP